MAESSSSKCEESGGQVSEESESWVSRVRTGYPSWQNPVVANVRRVAVRCQRRVTAGCPSWQNPVAANVRTVAVGCERRVTAGCPSWQSPAVQ